MDESKKKVMELNAETTLKQSELWGEEAVRAIKSREFAVARHALGRTVTEYNLFLNLNEMLTPEKVG